ncbi:hypothetical protein ACTXJK_16060 [Brachybacterium tyrofermentans]|uniref:hypothetical protein n=1 Tax=Brachybacterium tyrofermentans TaxID=47848 RepID=UPI003FD601BB
MTNAEERTLSPEWDDLLAAYTEWFDSTVERLGGMEKFLFRVAHRARRLDPYSELPALWKAATDRDSLGDRTASVKGYPTEHRQTSTVALPPLNSTIREAVTGLLQGVSRSSLTRAASDWESPFDLVAKIVERSEYGVIDSDSSNPIAVLEVGSALLESGQAENSLPFFAISRHMFAININHQIDLIEENAEDIRSWMHLNLRRHRAMEMDATLAFVRALIATGNFADAAEVVEESIHPDAPGSGPGFAAPEDHSDTDLEYVYWRSPWREFASSVYENTLFRGDVLLRVFEGDLLARTKKVSEAVRAWTICLDCAEEYAAAWRPDIAVAIAQSFQRLAGVRSTDLKPLIVNQRGLAVLDRALALRRKYEPVPDRQIAHYGPEGWRTEEVSDIEAEIHELEQIYGSGFTYASYGLSLAMRDGGELTISDAMLRKAAEHGHGVALLEVGINALKAGDELAGIGYLESAAKGDEFQAAGDEAVCRIVHWAMDTKNRETLSKWGPRAVKINEEELARM